MACCLLVVVVPLAASGQKRKEILFQIRDFPSRTNFQDMRETNYSYLRWIGSEEMLNRLKEKNMPLSQTDSSIATRQVKVVTGAADAASSFPISMEFVTSTTTGKKAMPPQGTIVYGRGRMNESSKIDSVSSAELSDAEKKQFVLLQRQTIESLYFPAKRMVVGDTVVTHMRISFPFLNKSVEFDIATTYELVTIGRKTADFNVTNHVTLLSTDFPYEMKVSGGGGGKLVYDPARSLGVRFESVVKFKLDIEMMPGLKLEGIFETKSISEVR